MNIAVYAGSFDPVTSGHLSVIHSAARLFPHVRVLVAVNPKKQTLLTAEERVSLLRELVCRYPNVTVDFTDGYVALYARSIGASVLVRGVRGATDAQFETELAHHNRAIAPEVATVFVPAEAELSDVSSTALKERIQRGDDVSNFCPEPVARLLRSRLAAAADRGESACKSSSAGRPQSLVPGAT